jgi:hypothetical protein
MSEKTSTNGKIKYFPIVKAIEGAVRNESSD